MSEVYRMKFVPTIMDGDRELRDKNEAKYAEIREHIFNLFKNNGFLGTGWYEMDLAPGMSEKEIESRFQELVTKKAYAESDRRGTIQAAKTICSIKKDDLIWVMEQGVYYLFKVSENACGKKWNKLELEGEKEFLLKSDIGNLFYGEWVTVGDMLKAPGIIVNAMGIGATFMRRPVAPELSQRIWNDLSGEEYYTIPKLEKSYFWHAITDRQKEGLALLYIQYKFNCMVNTESLKHSTRDYECELIGKDGRTRYYPQVKSGSTSLDVKKYFQYVKQKEQDGEKCIAVVFCENENYGNFKSEDLVLITKEELWTFIQDNKNIVSASILQAVALIDN